MTHCKPRLQCRNLDVSFFFFCTSLASSTANTSPAHFDTVQQPKELWKDRKSYLSGPDSSLAASGDLPHKATTSKLASSPGSVTDNPECPLPQRYYLFSPWSRQTFTSTGTGHEGHLRGGEDLHAALVLLLPPPCNLSVPGQAPIQHLRTSLTFLNLISTHLSFTSATLVGKPSFGTTGSVSTEANEKGASASSLKPQPCG